MIQLRIISPEKIIFNGTVDRVTLPGCIGNFTVLQRHTPLMTPLMKGVIEYVTDGRELSETIYGGFAEVRDNNVFVCLMK